MRHTKKLATAVGLIVLSATAAVLTLTLGSATADNIASDSLLARQLEGQGVRASTVRLEGDLLNVTLSTKKGGTPEDTWARVAARREASFLAGEGLLKASLIGTTILDEKGETIFYGDGPIEARPRPTISEAKKVDLDDARVLLGKEAAAKEVVIGGLELTADPSQGLIVDANLALTTEVDGESRDAQLIWITTEFLGGLRSYCEKTAGLDTDVYRLMIADPTGTVVVSYVVDAKARSAHAWLAPGYRPAWSMDRMTGLSSPQTKN